MVTELIGTRDIERAQKMIGEAGLRYEPNWDNLVGVFDGRMLAGVGARDRNIFKMIAVAPEYQNGSALGEIVSELIRIGFNAGQDAFFVFTAPQNASSFRSLNFHPLVFHSATTLLEYGNALERYLADHRARVSPGCNGAVVMNCNPFTLGHQYLIEKASALVDTLYVFVVREDRSTFPFDVRYRLVCEGVRELDNVVTLDSAHFAVSNLTFPAYFLKQGEDAARVQTEVDALLFARHLAPCFHIRRRFFGTEPYCRTTRLYNETMARILPDCGIEAQQMDRLLVDGQVVSAYRVREALRNEAYETVRRLVPKTTFDFLLSDEAQPLRDKLRNYHRRH